MLQGLLLIPFVAYRAVRALLLCAVELVVSVDSGLDVVIDDHAAEHLAVVQALADFCHVDDSGSGEAVQVGYFVECALLAALTNFHAVERHHEALDLNVGGSHQDGMRLLDGLARGGDVLDDDDAVAVAQLGAQQVAGVGAVILGFLTVGAVTNLLTIELGNAHSRDDGQRDALVSRAEDYVEIKTEAVVDGLSVVQTQTMKLIARDVCAGVHEEGGLAAALEREVAELQHVALHHEFDEFLLVCFHRFGILSLAFPYGLCGHADVICLQTCSFHDIGYHREVANLIVRLESSVKLSRTLNGSLWALMLVLAVALFGFGCAAGGEGSGGESEGGIPEGFEQAEVVRVVDGDTLQVRIDGEKWRVRLIGINCPESVASDESRNTAEGRDASDFTHELLGEGDVVWLQMDRSDVDQYDRLLRYVWIEAPSDPFDEDEIADKMLNAILVKEGYAEARIYGDDDLYAYELDALEREAVANGRGVSYMWA